MEAGKQILLVAQRSAGDDDPKPADIYSIGTRCDHSSAPEAPGRDDQGAGGRRVSWSYRIVLRKTSDLYAAKVEKIDVEEVTDREAEVLSRSLMTQFDQYVKLNKKVPPEIISSLSSIDDPSRLADTIAAHMAVKIEDKQGVLEIVALRERLEHLILLMEGEIDLLQVEKRHARSR